MATKLYWTDVDTGKVVTVIFDAVTTLTPDDVVDITEHPVEEGIDTSDNARSKATTLSIEAVVGMAPNLVLDDDAVTAQASFDVPMQFPGSDRTVTLDIPSPPIQLSESGLLQAGIGAILGALSGAPKVTGPGPTVKKTVTVSGTTVQQTTPRNRVRDVYDVLLKLKDDHTLVTILTAQRDHFDMMMSHIGAPRTAADGSSGRFQIDFTQIRTATSSTVAAPKPAEARGNPKVNKGGQSTKPATKPEDKESLLYRTGLF